MDNKINSEFHYKYELVSGETAWHKVRFYKTILKDLKYESDISGENIKFIQDEIAGLQYAKTMSSENREKAKYDTIISKKNIDLENAQNEFDINKKNVQTLRSVMQESVAIASANIIVGKTEEEMYALNAENEYAQSLAKDLQAEIISLGKPKVETIKRAMITTAIWEAMKAAGLIPANAEMVLVNNDATKIAITKKL